MNHTLQSVTFVRDISVRSYYVLQNRCKNQVISQSQSLDTSQGYNINTIYDLMNLITPAMDKLGSVPISLNEWGVAQ